MTELIIQTGKHKGRVIELPEGEILVGNAIGCQIRLISGEIAEKHCMLDVSSDGVQIRPVAADTPALVNDDAIHQSTALKDGDVLSVGDVRLKVADEATRVDKGAGAASGIDGDIASWLSDDGAGAPKPTKPTTRTKKAATESAAPKAMKKQRKFDSVAEEGADIIRRYLESVGKDD